MQARSERASSMGLEVRVAPEFQKHLDELTRQAKKKPAGAQATQIEALKSLFENVLGDPVHAVSAQTSLRGDLKPVRRVRQGRFRVFYICCRKTQRVRVLFMGLRRDGDRRDAYEAFERALKSKRFDAQFQELDIKLPKAAGSRPKPARKRPERRR